MSETMAAVFGRMFHNDGQCLQTDDGRTMSECAEEAHIRVRRPFGCWTRPIVYEFEDGSAVVEYDGVWDIRAAECVAHCWDGVGCQCGNRAEWP